MGKKSDAPVRSCIGCRSKFPKEELVRFSADKSGKVRVDPFYKNPGRGVYLCPKLACFRQAFKKRGAFNRALRRQVEVPQNPEALLYETLQAFEKEREGIKKRLEGLREGEGKRLSLSLQRIDKMIERLRLCEE